MLRMLADPQTRAASPPTRLPPPSRQRQDFPSIMQIGSSGEQSLA